MACDVFDVVELFCAVFRLCVAEDVPTDVEVVVGSPCWTQRGLADPVGVVACGDVVAEDGDVTVHVFPWWHASADFRFYAE